MSQSAGLKARLLTKKRTAGGLPDNGGLPYGRRTEIDVMDTSSRPQEMALTISSLILKLFYFYKRHYVDMTTDFPMT